MMHTRLTVVNLGWYGLVAARTFLELAPKTSLLIVDDSATVGGVWSGERIYPSLFAQISHPLFEYSFYPMSRDGLSPDGFVSGATIHNYLDQFARDYKLRDHMRLMTKVVHVRRSPNERSWILEVNEGQQIGCDKLIYATGANSSAIIPQWPRRDFEKPVIHSLQIGDRLDYIASTVQRATVVGRSKSSYDAVFQLLNAGKKVDWIMRDSISGPFSIYAPTFMGLWNIADHISTRMASNFSPCIMNTSGFWYHLLQRTLMGRAVTNLYWRTATYLSARYAGYSRSENAEKLRPRPRSDGYGNMTLDILAKQLILTYLRVFWGSGGIGIATVPNFWKVFHNGDVKIHQTEVESLSHKDVVNLRNGYSVATDIVIHCTGFDKGYQTFDEKLQEELGLSYDTKKPSRWTTLDEKAEETVNELLPYLRGSPMQSKSVRKELLLGPNRHYRRLVVPQLAAQGDRSILFPGHIHSAFTPLAAELQALWGVSWMLGWRDLPSQEDMETEAATFNAWTRKRYLEQGKKHAYFIYDYLPVRARDPLNGMRDALLT